MNLCNNARDAMPDGGRLVIKAVRQGKQVMVTVTDTGGGMDREAVGKCFDPFYTTKPIGKGTGLGLSTTYGIIKSHDGMISVDSQPNRGTTFTILFSLALDEQHSEQKDSPVIIRGKGQRVLVVDDEPEILNAMQDLLEYLGYRPELAENGKRGLEKYRSKNPDVVLMDINMPEMNGITCIEKILNYDPKANISIFSGYEEEGVEGMSQRAKDAIKDYLAKPVGLEALSVVLAKMLKENEK
jgi:CheY-like chemotaxis protein